jgi:hypothetical protein
MKNGLFARRSLMSGLTAAAAAFTLGSRSTGAQSLAGGFQPARHPQDEWMDKLPGRHRVILDMTTPEGVPEGIRFAGNVYTGHELGYGVKETDLAIIMVLRHSATAYGYGEAIWARHGKLLDSKATEPPKGNPYDLAPRSQLSGLARRGVHFIVCGSASQGIARRLAGQNGDADAMMKEMTANMIPNSHITAGVAGVVPLVHAQELGYSLIYCG